MMVRTPDSSEDLFAETATNWDLQKLYKDLAVAKGEFAPHKRGDSQRQKKNICVDYFVVIVLLKWLKSYIKSLEEWKLTCVAQYIGRLNN